MPKADEDGLKDFLMDKLALDRTFVEQDMGPVIIKRNIEWRQKSKDEICVEFENKQVRDVVKALGHQLANYREEAGMRLQIPDSLQKDFKALMAVAYDKKKTNKDLKRNVKFDEENMALFMDLDGDWKRIRPQQAYKALESRSRSGGPEDMDEDEIKTLLGETSE